MEKPGVELEDGTFIESKTVVLTTGTYMTSNVLRGHTSTVSGPEAVSYTHLDVYKRQDFRQIQNYKC